MSLRAWSSCPALPEDLGCWWRPTGSSQPEGPHQCRILPWIWALHPQLFLVHGAQPPAPLLSEVSSWRPGVVGALGVQGQRRRITEAGRPEGHTEDRSLRGGCCPQKALKNSLPG